MKNNNRTAKQNLLTPSQGGGAFTLAIFAGLFTTLILSVIVSGIANAKHLPFDQVTKMNGVIWLTYLVPQLVLLAVGVGVMVYAKASPRDLPHEKPTLWGVLATVLLWIGLLFGFQLLNEYFLRFLELTGYRRPENVMPVMDTFGGYFVSVLVMALLPALAEELLFRGILLSGTEGGKNWQRIVLCGALFCVFHQNPMQTPYQFLCGCAFAYLTLKTGNVYLAIGVHFLNNFYILTATYMGIPAFGTLAIVIATVTGLLAFVGAILILHWKTPKRTPCFVQENPVKRTFFWSLAGVCGCVIMWIANFITGFGV